MSAFTVICLQFSLQWLQPPASGLLGFTASRPQPQQALVCLMWFVQASEEPGYTIQQSPNGSQWHDVLTIPGDSLTTGRTAFHYCLPAPRSTYYRIAILRAGQLYAFSPVRFVTASQP